MPINSRPLGPGTLTLGTGTPLEVSSQLTACKVTPSETVETAERLKVLSGETKGGNSSPTYAYVLEGNFLQDDPGASSVVDYSWDNAGELVDFEFVPSTEGGRIVSGQLTPVPLTIGGDEVDGPDMSSDFAWRIDGTPDRSTVV